MSVVDRTIETQIETSRPGIFDILSAIFFLVSRRLMTPPDFNELHMSGVIRPYPYSTK